jgi:hypothetical protein
VGKRRRGRRKSDTWRAIGGPRKKGRIKVKAKEGRYVEGRRKERMTGEGKKGRRKVMEGRGEGGR